MSRLAVVPHEAPPEEPGRYLSRPKAAEFLTDQGLKTSAKTLATYATMGTGPEFRRWGRRVVYEKAALLAWCQSRLSEPTTNSWVE